MTLRDIDDRTAAATAAALDDRGVIAVCGPDAGVFLQGLVTNDVSKVAPGLAQYAALLTPQGKIIVDFLIAADGSGGYLLDCPAALAPDLARRLGLYRLRAKVTIENRSAALGVVAMWGSRGQVQALERSAAGAVVYPDPRHAGLGWRAIAARPAADPGGAPPGSGSGASAYETLRIANGVPKGGVDFVYGDTFTHEANLDRLHGLDFKKGCYVGQEVVSRIEHRGLARKRIVPVRFDGASPPAGSDVAAGDVSLGTMGSAAGGQGLAMLRLDRVAEAAAAGTPIVAAGGRLEVGLPV